MTVYVAAPWAERDRAKEVAEKITAAGHVITHDWWNHDVPDQDEEGLLKCANDDTAAIFDADAFFLMNLQPRGQETSGKAVEMGLALGLHILAGEPVLFAMGIRGTNVFQLMPFITWIKDEDEFIQAINRLERSNDD